MGIILLKCKPEPDVVEVCEFAILHIVEIGGVGDNRIHGLGGKGQVL